MLTTYVVPGLRVNCDRFRTLYFQYDSATPVSYTHLDVYKRQVYYHDGGDTRILPIHLEYMPNIDVTSA